MGFKRPESWRRILLIALAAAAFRILLGQFVIEPLTAFYLAEANCAGIGKRDYRKREDCVVGFTGGVDFCRVR